jgi:putative oxidoreductase
MNSDLKNIRWATAAILIGRIIFVLVFAMALSFKLIDTRGTASYIGSAGFPAAMLLACLAAALEVVIILSFLTGAFFSRAALVAAAYVLFLAFAFHGPSHWAADQNEFGFFVDHFTFIAGLLFAAANGPGTLFVVRREPLPRAVNIA